MQLVAREGGVEYYRVVIPAGRMMPEVSVYVVVSSGEALVFDSGPGYRSAARRVLKAARELSGEAVVVSHAHPDHAGGAKHLQSTGTLALASRREAEVIEDMGKLLTLYYGVSGFERLMMKAAFRFMGFHEARVDATLSDGDVVKVGEARFRVLELPGHTPGHIALLEEESRVMLSGDMLGEGPTWIGPPAGSHSLYMKSLRRIAELKPRLVLPAHGRPTRRAEERARRIIQGRERRLREVLNSVGSEKTVRQVAMEVYRPRGPWMQAACERAVLGYLAYLEERGLVECIGRGGKISKWRFRSLATGLLEELS